MNAHPSPKAFAADAKGKPVRAVPIPLPLCESEETGPLWGRRATHRLSPQTSVCRRGMESSEEGEGERTGLGGARCRHDPIPA